MKIFIKRVTLFLFLFVTAIPAFADIPSPNKTPAKRPVKTNEIRTSMNIAPDKEVKDTTLIIPRSMAQQLAMELSEDGSLNAASSNRFNLTPTQTIMFGMFLSLSVIFAGVWFVRSRVSDKTAARIVVAIALMALGAATTTAVYANIRPPSLRRTITSGILIPEVRKDGVTGGVRIVVSDDQDKVILKVPVQPDAAQ